MASFSKIEWTEVTWNPVTGCTKVSDGCKNCYAERMAKRLQAMGSPRYKNGFDLTIHEDLLSQPFQWKQPKTIFVNSMSDLFHEEVPIGFIKSVFDVMVNCPQHTFQILTKRSSRLVQLAYTLPWPINVWIGVSVENSAVLHRVEDLRSIPAYIKFLSCEPLLGPLDGLNLEKIDWVIVGGESGPFSRPMKPEWVEGIYSKCVKKNTPFFFKQWGGTRKHLTGRKLHNRIYDEMPNLKEKEFVSF